MGYNIKKCTSRPRQCDHHDFSCRWICTAGNANLKSVCNKYLDSEGGGSGTEEGYDTSIYYNIQYIHCKPSFDVGCVFAGSCF